MAPRGLRLNRVLLETLMSTCEGVLVRLLTRKNKAALDLYLSEDPESERDRLLAAPLRDQKGAERRGRMESILKGY